MKTRRFFLAALAVILAGLFVWVFFAHMASPATRAGNIAGNPRATKSALSHNMAAPTGKLALPTDWRVMPVDAKIASTAGQAKIQQFQQIADGENSRSLTLYGQVIDQKGNPVVGARVLGRTLLIVGFGRSGGDYHYTETDSEGRFQFIDLRGMSLTVTPQKSGYEYNARLPPNWSEGYKPDSSRPMVFTLWKLRGAEPMIHADVDKRLLYDERTGIFEASFDLSTGKISGSGELHITLNQNPLVVKRGIDRYDWKVTITVRGGNLLEATDLYKNLAPEGDYEDAYSFERKKSDPKWDDRFAKFFYVRTAKGHYARVSIDLTPGSNRPEAGLGVGMSLSTWLNPSGSRNLEFDASKEIKTAAYDRSL